MKSRRFYLAEIVKIKLDHYQSSLFKWIKYEKSKKKIKKKAILGLAILNRFWTFINVQFTEMDLETQRNLKKVIFLGDGLIFIFFRKSL